jgi:TFIIF, beta subunit HTH domain/TFIIF, beta subunit N-terminus
VHNSHKSKSTMDENDDEDDDESQVERVTADSYGALDTSQVSDECWMIRIPPRLADLWKKQQEGTELGELVFTKGGTITDSSGKTTTIKPSLTVQVSHELEEAHGSSKPAPRAGGTGNSVGKSSGGTVPLNYSLQAMTKKVPVMHPFTRNPNNGSCSLLGTVSRTANLQVEQDSTYRAQLKDRLVATNLTGSRFVKPVEASESIISQQRTTTAVNVNSNKKSFGNAVYQFGKRLQEASQDASLAMQQQQQGPAKKKAHQFAPDQPLRSVIFELFGQQPYWTIKDFKAAAVAGGCVLASTKRAEQEIRDILRNEIGEYHRSGDHKNQWELRKEFRQQSNNSTNNGNA